MPTHTDPKERAVREARFAPLGALRLNLLGCLGGDMRFLPQYVPTPEPEADLFALYRAFVERMLEQQRGEEDVHSLLATARLLTGDITAADEILNNLRPDRYASDHGTGFCIWIASRALAVVLPLPADFPKPQPNYVAGSAEEAALRAWLAEHRDALVWDEIKGVYLKRGSG
ncbi:MAG TPA: hypothetical protein VJR89_23470 [Polyangiales bacterium]|nr:hypothetical protein [Polyangiales bacterium]